MIYVSHLHPIVLAFYFASVLVITMFTKHPILQATAMLGGIMFYVNIEKQARFWKEFGLYAGLFVIVTITNPIFSHHGTTPLFFLNGNPITLEALLYGANLAFMLIAVVYWFKCFNKVMTEDKLLYLFGKISPKVAILFSSAVRFIPLLKMQSEKIKQSQSSIGVLASEVWTDKLHGTIRVYSALITWALENAIDTGSAMKARGYGLKGRKYYSLYTFRQSDGILLGGILAGDVIMGMVFGSGKLDFAFYPSILVKPLTGTGVVAIITFAVLSFMPFMIEMKEGLQWKYYRSKI